MKEEFLMPRSARKEITTPVVIPTREEFLAKYQYDPLALELIIAAAFAIKYNNKKVLQHIKRQGEEHREMIYKALNDPEFCSEVKNKGISNETIKVVRAYTSFTNKAGLILRLIWGFERRNIIPGLPKEQAIEFVINLAESFNTERGDGKRKPPPGGN